MLQELLQWYGNYRKSLSKRTGGYCFVAEVFLGNLWKPKINHIESMKTLISSVKTKEIPKSMQIYVHHYFIVDTEITFLTQVHLQGFTVHWCFEDFTLRTSHGMLSYAKKGHKQLPQFRVFGQTWSNTIDIHFSHTDAYFWWEYNYNSKCVLAKTKITRSHSKQSHHLDL